MTPTTTNHLTVERAMPLAPEVLFRAWTEGFGVWFAVPDTVRMRPVEGEPFYFETDFEGSRHAHYGRFLRLVPGQTVELTWITFEGGTEGAETVVTVELIPRGPDETDVRLTHAGFVTAQHRDRHRDAWPLVLEQMQQRLAG